MNVSKRFFIQSISWLILWFILWTQAPFRSTFFYGNISILICQIIIVAIGLYVLVPKLLFPKKYVLFALSSIMLLFVLSLSSSRFSNAMRATSSEMNSEFREIFLKYTQNCCHRATKSTPDPCS